MGVRVLFFCDTYKSAIYFRYLRRKKLAKNDEFLLPVTYFFADRFFYRGIFLPTFFYKREHLLFPNLKIPLLYLFDF